MSYLHSNHPSANTQQAAFLFSVDGGMFYVLAINPFAVQAIELLCGDDHSPAPGIGLLAIFRDPGTIGIRNPNQMVELSYPKFLTQVADKRRIQFTPGLQQCIADSLTEEDREQISIDIQATEEASQAPNDCSEQLKALLGELGYKSSQIEDFLKSVGARTASEPVEILLREAIRQLSS